MTQTYQIDLRGDELQSKLGGGIPTGSTVLLEGPNGYGKSIFSQRITYGALQNNHSVTYISTELTVSSFLNQMDSLKYDVKQEFVDKTFRFISTYPVMGDIELEDNLIEKLFDEPALFKSDIVIFDALNEILVEKDIDLQESYKLMSMFNKITSQGKTLILCADPDRLGETFRNVLQTSSNVYFELGEKEEYGTRMNVLRINRFHSAQDDFDKELPFKVRAGIGIVIELSA